MAQQKKMVENITSMEEDFSQWYTDVVKKAELMDYSSVKGCMVIEPYGYALWENMQADLDRRDTGLDTAGRARSVLGAVELYRRDLTIHLGADSGCLGGLDPLLEGLEERGCQV